MEGAEEATGKDPTLTSGVETVEVKGVGTTTIVRVLIREKDPITGGPTGIANALITGLIKIVQTIALTITNRDTSYNRFGDRDRSNNNDRGRGRGINKDPSSNNYSHTNNNNTWD